MEVALYLRKSRAEELSDTTDETLARHKRLLVEYAKAHQYAVLEAYEEVVSGESLYARPQMLRLLESVEAGLYDGVLCMDIDRLGRGGSRDQGIILETFKYSSTQIITLDKVYDLSLESDEMLAEFKGIISRQEYRMITKRLRRGLEETIKEGGYVSNAPYGYRRIYKERTPTLEINEDEAAFVRMMFEWYSKGIGCETIAKKVTALGAKPHRSQEFSRNSVRKILSSPTYLGKVVWNQKQHLRPGKNGNKLHQITYNPPEKWLVIDGVHPPIVEPEIFEKVQAVLKGRYIPSKKVAGVLANPLAGLVLCGNCGKRVQLKYSTGIPYLMCMAASCTSGAKFEVVESSIFSVMCKDLSFLKLKYDQIASTKEKDGVSVKSNISACEKELQKVEKQKSKLRDLLEQEVYDIATYRQRMQVLETRQKELETHMTKFKEESMNFKMQIIGETINRLEDVFKLYNSADINDKNQLLKSVVSKITYLRPGRSADVFLIIEYVGLGRVSDL